MTDNCPTCQKPYIKSEICVCSDLFHCCRDCLWETTTDDGLSYLELIQPCDDCEKQQESNERKFERLSKK